MRYFYIQDTRSWAGDCVMFWRPEGKGYTPDIKDAGKFSEDQALHIVKCRPTDVALPCDQIDDKTTVVVMQNDIGKVTRWTPETFKAHAPWTVGGVRS